MKSDNDWLGLRSLHREAVSKVSDDMVNSFSLREKVRLRGNDATVILVLSNG